MSKKILIPLGKGFEEIEAITLIDVLRRAEIEVTVAGIDEKIIEGANNIAVKTDISVYDINSDDFDMIILPGGWGGTDILSKNNKVQTILKEMNSKNKMIGAICAAPFALNCAGVLKDKWTCYPSVEEQINKNGYIADKKVIIDNNIVTSRGPATAIYFALEIVKLLKGEELYLQLKNGLLVI